MRPALAAAVCGLVALVGCGPSAHEPAVRPERPRRIVSMSPGLTETLFALGLGDRVVGVSRFCDYPPAARDLPRIGGYLDPNWEAIVACRPDLVVVMESQGEVEAGLARLGLESFRVDQGNVASILDSFEALGRRCGVPDRGAKLRGRVEADLASVADRVAGRPRPRVLVSVGRTPGTGPVRTVWAAGRGTFVDDVVELAGGVNALPGGTAIAYPEIAAEGLMEIDPDVILDFLPELGDSELTPADVVADWDGLRPLRAVEAGRVHVVSGRFISIPGPRVARVVETVARVLHPEVDWS